MRSLRMRFWLESALAGTGVVLCCLTLLWRDWIEAVSRLDPDRHSGAVEWLVVLLTVALALTCTWLARIEWRRTSASPA